MKAKNCIEDAQHLLELANGYLQKISIIQFSLADAHLEDYQGALSDFLLCQRLCYDSRARRRILSTTALRSREDKIQSIPNR